jgi:mRNA (guanine-N7-)-methyltransferase
MGDFVTTDIEALLNGYSKYELVNCIEKNEKVFPKFVKDMNNQTFMYTIRFFHRLVKKLLITSSSRVVHAQNVLELAVGHGGDFWNWKDSNVKKIVGIDKNHDALYSKDGALERSKNVKGVDIQLMEADLTQFQYNFEHKFDIVSCQFALHYFFESKEILNNFIKFVSESLKKNGLFIGTTVDGSELIKLLNGKNSFSNDVFEIKRVSRSKGIYGNKYSFLLKINTNYYSNNSPIDEYFVNFDELKKVAKKHSLEIFPLRFITPSIIENTVSFEQLYNIKHIVDWPGNKEIKNLDSQELEFTKLNSIFVFKKVK